MLVLSALIPSVLETHICACIHSLHILIDCVPLLARGKRRTREKIRSRCVGEARLLEVVYLDEWCHRWMQGTVVRMLVRILIKKRAI